MIKKLIDKFKGYALSVAARKGGLILANLLASGTAAAWMTDKAQPYIQQYGPIAQRYGINVTPEVFFTAVCGFLATLIHDAYGVAQQNKNGEASK